MPRRMVRDRRSGRGSSSGAPSAPAASFRDDSGLIWLLDARDIAQSDGTAVSVWPAHVGPDTAAFQGSPTYRASGLRGSPSVEFDGNDALQVATFAGDPSNWSLIVLFSNTQGTGANALLSNYGADDTIRFFPDANASGFPQFNYLNRANPEEVFVRPAPAGNLGSYDEIFLFQTIADTTLRFRREDGSIPLDGDEAISFQGNLATSGSQFVIGNQVGQSWHHNGHISLIALFDYTIDLATFNTYVAEIQNDYPPAVA